MTTTSTMTATLLITALLLTLLAACAPPADPVAGKRDFPTAEGGLDAEIAPDAIPRRTPRACPALDSMLFQLTQADDPLLAAEQLGLRLKDDKVQVLLILASEDTDFLGEFGVELGTQSGNQIQVFAPIDRLCQLADASPVLAVRPPAQALP